MRILVKIEGLRTFELRLAVAGWMTSCTTATIFRYVALARKSSRGLISVPSISVKIYYRSWCSFSCGSAALSGPVGTLVSDDES